MSRAFIKEPDSNQPEELTELPVSENRNLVTRNGMRLIEQKLADLRKELAGAEKADNKNLAAQLSRDIRYWSARKASAEIIKLPQNTDKVVFDTKVTIRYENGRKKTFHIVGEDEADPSKGLLSYMSPVAQALIGNEMGATVKINEDEVEIIDISN